MEINVDHKIIRELMDKDPDFSVKVKQAVLNTAIKHEVFKAASGQIRREIDREISEANRKIASGWPNALLPNVKELIVKTVNDQIDRVIVDVLGEGMKNVKELLLEKINTRAKEIERLVDDYVERTVNIEVATYCREKVKSRIAEIVSALEEKNE